MSSTLVPRTLRVPAALTALALGGWIASAVAMNGMMAMEGPGSIPSFLWLWIAMSAAMMLPALVPAASLASGVGRSAAAFVGGYAAVWAATGMLAYEAADALAVREHLARCRRHRSRRRLPADAAQGRVPAPLQGAARVADPPGRFPGGLEHGLVCLGCCWALMLALLALGTASLFWMAAVAAAIFVEKVTSIGARASAPVALALVGAAVWVVL